MSTIVYACSTNPGKLREFDFAARECGLESIAVASLPGLSGITPPEENGMSFEQNARLKAAYYSNFTPELVFADDSGLEVDALGGAPGIYSARFAGTDATDATNNELLLNKLASHSDRRARFVCALAIAQDGHVLHTVRGTVEGEILHAPCGRNGFGYDPLFYYPPFQQSLAQVPPEQKFAVSHRGNALRALFHWLANQRV
ncbi:MAG: RdgB/HAM1 family non-canonical purine NTP pyrophosphatase [Acidobacteriaceae bacterium]|nr:RdgB/HAM1 family non-canonical purine NTP pyrophosphatase [Acidobacteriaceae bacterium]